MSPVMGLRIDVLSRTVRGMPLALSFKALKEKIMQEKHEGGRGARHVREVMTANPDCVSGSDSVRDVARIMAKSDTGVVPVVDGKKIIGLVTDRDIVVRLVAEGKDLTKASANDVMTRGVHSVQDTASISDVMKLMSSAQVRRIPVVDRNDEIVGIVSLADLATETGQASEVGHTVTQISEGNSNN